MKLKPIALANTFAILAFASFTICMVWAMVDRSSFIAFWESWAHGFNLELIATDSIGSINTKSIFGMASFTASSWVLGYVSVWLYQKLDEKS